MKILWLVLLACCVPWGPARAVAAAPTNFVVFLTDDLGWGDLGCYGHPRIQTPNLDQFASEGVRLTQCYSACSVCSPSRSAILTGRTPYRNGVWRWIPAGSQYHLRTSETTIAEILKERGYATCHAGKWHLNGLFNEPAQPQPDDHGYDHWLATQNNAAPHHVNPDNFVRNGQPVGPLEGASSMICVEEAIGWLKSRSTAGQPFFLTLWTHEPHLPIETREEYLRLYADLPDADLRQHHGNVTQMDAAFGRLMRALDEMGLRENTVVFFTSDNGPEGDGTKGRTRGSTAGLRGRKRHSHEGGIRVPGMVRWPSQIAAGSQSDTPVIGSDIFATICEIVQAPLPADRTIDGASWLPLFKNQPVVRQQPLYWRNHLAPREYRVALRDGDWKIVGSDDLASFELYNLRDDWQESRDLSGQHPEKFAELKARLIAHDAAVLREGPDWWKDEAQPAEGKVPKKQRPAAAPATPAPVAEATELPPTYANVAYGSDPRQVLDLWQATGDGPRPLLVHIHGGGWTMGDKSRTPADVKPYLDRGISYASINYRLTSTAILPAPVHDAARAIQFLRSRAAEWNLRSDRIVLTGGSAGACTSMWILCHDDLAQPDSSDPVARQSTRVAAAAVSAGQTSIDPKVIEPWLGPNVLQHRMIHLSVGEPTIEQALANYAQHRELYREFSPYNHVTADDPPLLMTYSGAMTLPSTSGGHGIHHPVYGIKMKERCDQAGQECHLIINDDKAASRYPSAEAFIFDKLLK